MFYFTHSIGDDYNYKDVLDRTALVTELKEIAFHFDKEIDDNTSDDNPSDDNTSDDNASDDNTSKPIVDIKTKELLTQCLTQCMRDYYNDEVPKYWNTIVPKQFMMIGGDIEESQFMDHMAEISVKLIYKPFHDRVDSLLINDESGDISFEYNKCIIDALWKQVAKSNSI